MGYILSRLFRLARVWLNDVFTSRPPTVDFDEDELRRLIEEASKQRSSQNDQTTATISARVRWAYQTLGITPMASVEEIKRAYRTKIKQYHPDRLRHYSQEKQQYAQQKAREINIAYTILKQERNF